MGSVKRTNEEWIKLYEQQRMSGQTLKAWCAENNINLSTMSDKISRLKKAGLLSEQNSRRNRKTKVETKWAEVTSLATDTEIQVEINGFTVIVPVDFNEAAFIRVCKVLKLC
ncbi:hypothetical protein EHE19_005560 [Ruminiclostridium herbifermentans]|jgi:hypothetical protein|uniref:Uncharacterized protein n=1 Tax=Ruminiclostridium herbifermentans TaxID=2488810 RepID=A0A7H1VPJ9_9FIRM|nr:hypothetical protein [Ruminiclostridium herbifermentans]QNU65560.1 hypothetical protein EHE19_011535 [Ruminiclostridium herbifermentans]QNU65933.1 hypothetical protein EHE19_013685 [Ruminiclostridium herbifermentans]QNU67311.1 hypothetical protein EHE19_001860 [Ruminiclostridium herbifermentans]QNU67914.1 hypothetical protein EHE19_005560 [Ruminiclostridium herbifermentans]